MGKVFHNVVRLRKFFYKNSLNLEIVVINNRCKLSSKKVIDKIGTIQLKKPRQININSMVLGYHLNKGAVLHKSVKKYMKYVLNH